MFVSRNIRRVLLCTIVSCLKNNYICHCCTGQSDVTYLHDAPLMFVQLADLGLTYLHDGNLNIENQHVICMITFSPNGSDVSGAHTCRNGRLGLLYLLECPLRLFSLENWGIVVVGLMSPIVSTQSATGCKYAAHR